jgi:hypothetical protein
MFFATGGGPVDRRRLRIDLGEEMVHVGVVLGRWSDDGDLARGGGVIAEAVDLRGAPPIRADNTASNESAYAVRSSRSRYRPLDVPPRNCMAGNEISISNSVFRSSPDGVYLRSYECAATKSRLCSQPAQRSKCAWCALCSASWVHAESGYFRKSPHTQALPPGPPDQTMLHQLSLLQPDPSWTF